MWESLDKERPDSAHYAIMKRLPGIDGMGALQAMFEEAKANELNFVLFSTSGVHGTYNTIEDAEDKLNNPESEHITEVTFLIVHPRLVALRYGTCNPQNMQDIEFLKALRASSKQVVNKIGEA